MAFRCWHKWTQWVKVGDITYEGKKVGFCQERRCKKCGYLESKRTFQV